MTPYNLAASTGRALTADAFDLLDPGADGTVSVHPKGTSILKVRTTGARTLQAATQLDLNTTVLVVTDVSGVTVNSQAIADGGHALFRVTMDASGDNQWVMVENSASLPANAVTRAAAASGAGIVLVSGGADRSATSPTPVEVSGDISTYLETAFKSVLTALAAAGIITDSTTT